MKPRLLILLCAIYISYASYGTHSSYASPPPATLRWLNGESLPGALIAATGTTATFQSPFFEDPLILSWSCIHRIDWPIASPSTLNHQPSGSSLHRIDWPIDSPSTLNHQPSGSSPPTDDPFLISLRDGSNIQGQLLAITGSSIFIHATRYGDVALQRSQVLSARRMKNDSMLMAGPTGDVNWQPMQSQNDGRLATKDSAGLESDGVAAFGVGPGGSLQIPYWNRTALSALDLPDSVDVEFHLHSTARPNFRFSIEDHHGAALRIETWDDALVAALSNETDFQLIRKIDSTEHDIALRFYWDWKTRHCMVFTPAGDLITDWQAPEDHSSTHPGVILQNKGRDLSLDFLRIRKWNGAPPPKIDLTRSRVELDDGRILPGGVLSGTAGSIKLSGEGTQPAITIPLKDVDAFIFSPDAATETPAEVRLTFSDGTYLQGKLSAVKDGIATIATTFSAQPLATRMDGLRKLLVDAPAPPDAPPAIPLAKLDRLLIRKTTFHGALATAGDGSPRWLPVGGVAPVIPSKTIPWQIIRSFPDNTSFSKVPALFYTRAGDALPGTLRSIDRAGVEFDPAITEAAKLPASVLEAIQFAPSAALNMHGFNNTGWRILKGDDSKIRRTGDSLEMDPESSIGHPAAMQSGEIRFGLDTTSSFSTVRLRMFCAGTNPAKSTNLLFVTGINGNQVICGIEGQDGQFEDQQIRVNVPDGPVSVRLVIHDKDLALYLNNARMGVFSIPPSRRIGSGLIIEPAGIWGNRLNPIKLTGFSMLSDPGGTWLPDVAPDAKTQALTLPRFRRDDPPSHALIATNGDILRGEIEAATTTSFGFRSGLEELTVPRDRVKAVIFLDKPQDAPPPPPAKSPTLQLLDQQLNGRIRFGGGASLQSFTNFLQNQVAGLQFKIPGNLGNQSFPLQLGGETVAAALDRICTLYGLNYHVDDKGVIVFGPAGNSAPADMVEKLYWLKPNSLPAGAPADKTLAATGITFPPGASASWDAATGQLRMQNTPDNHALLLPLLSSAFGGSLGSPTHWLLLASGARIGLAVDKFDKDVILGRHPIYGRCSIPTADVVKISTFPLDPSPVMKSVEDWHMVYAPEPVLPEPGGDSSTLIGKAAPLFKLPLLSGQDFDLSQSKGKVVVLDFWATWCGPCVRSLPELIEAMSPFSPDRVKFVAIDQDEPAPQIKQFLETRGWKLEVALDDGQRVGRQYGADAIPLTVIIAPDGKVAWSKTGYTPDGEAEAAKAVTKLLGP